MTDIFENFTITLGIKKPKKNEVLENIKNTITENNIYDNLLLSFNYEEFINQNFTPLDIIENKETIIKTYITNSSIIKKDHELFDNFINNYKTLKIIAKYYNYKLVLYDINETILDNIDGNKEKTLYFLFNGDKIYPLKYKSYKFRILIPKLNYLINFYIKRDIIRNSRYVLFSELINYKNHFIKYKDVGNFKYKYLIDEINYKKIEDITEENIQLYKYLINNFGLHFYIIENYLKVDKNLFNLEFVSTFKDYIIPDFPKNEYINLKENNENQESRIYNYINEQLRICIYGNTIEQVIEKGIQANIIINKSEIKKSLTYLDFTDIITENDIIIIKEIFKDQDFIYYRKRPIAAELILATEKINLDNNIDTDYIIQLYEKEPVNYCQMCNCVLDWNSKSIDAINPMFGHVKNNIQLLCLNCNIFKNIRFIGKYSKKPYYYDINTLSKNKLIEILKYHNLNLNGIVYTLRNRLHKYIKNID